MPLTRTARRSWPERWPGPWSWLLLSAVVLAVRGAFALEPPGRDQGLFWTQAELLLSGARLYERVWEHKPPGILLLYAAARALSADYVVVHVLNGVAVLASASMLLVIARRRGLSPAAAMFAALAYAIFASGPAFGGYWMIAQPEVFLDPLLCAALLLLSVLESGRPARALLAGIAIGCAVAAIKYSALPWLALCAFVPRRSATGPRAHADRLAFLAGCALAPLALLAYFALTGRAGAFLDATVAFNLEHARVGSSAFWDDPLTLALPLLASLLMLYVFAGAAIADRVARRGRSEPSDAALRLGAALWLLALLQVVLQGKYWTYHYHVMLLPLAILGAVGFDRLRALIASRARTTTTAATLACALIALIGCSVYLMQVAMYARQYALIAAMRGELSDERFALGYSRGRDDYSFGIDRLVAAKIAQTTQPDDTVFVWGFEPILYSLAKRAPATRFLYDYPLMPRFSQHAAYARALMQDLRARPPALILVLHDDTNDLERDDSRTQLAALPELAAFIARDYTETWSAGQFTCYERAAGTHAE